MTLRDDATERQVQSADPEATTWVSANAGSGKTRVLTDRVARLLLRGVEPQRILCLTYTKAAASEMQNRLFARLGSWAMKSDETLRKELADLGEAPATSPAALAKARRLFARALETPGGLRIQTIHSFCATLLRRFPLEAGVSPGFAELDDRAARLLRAQIVEEMALSGADAALGEIARIYTGDDFTRLMEQVVTNRHGFTEDFDEPLARAQLGLGPDMTEDRLLSQSFLGNEAPLFSELIPLLTTSEAKTDLAAAARLAVLNWQSPGLAELLTLEQMLLFGSGTTDPAKAFTAKIDGFPTKDMRTAFSGRMDQLNALSRRVEAARRERLKLDALRKTAILHRFALAFLPRYREAKARHGWLDFDDLIFRAKTLLSDSSVAAWVLFRLDGGIDHILVDEAQDTSPDQWKVIELLAAEFTAGQGAQGDRARTLFVVGDKKQSIYSFQGADVAGFDTKRQLFRDRFRSAGLQFQNQELSHSFRSAPAILRLVDATFGKDFPDALGHTVEHLAFRPELPGRVDLWPLIEPVATEDDEAWEDPVDLISESHHGAQLANQIAAEIRKLIESGTSIPGEDGAPRPVHAGDFLILVQRRSTLFAEVIRACKQAGLAIAGADRLKLGGELAVKDLAALLSFLATPEDSLSLAAALRSPLFGWSEDELFRLAHGRSGFLWEALRRDEGHPETLAMLRDLLDHADFLRPFDLIERILTRHDGRRRMLTRLGDEAEDGIDELLSQALAYEASEVPSLTGFLIWLVSDDVTVKRLMDSAGKRIRVMTVHGAKGLEAPIVILPDTTDRKPQDRDEIYRLAGGLPVWKTPAEASPEAIRETRARRKADQEAESARLLYVALTRPKCWLIIAGAGEAKVERKAKGKAEAEVRALSEWCWYRLAEKAMRALGAETIEAGRLRLSSGIWPAPVTIDAAPSAAEVALPDWAGLPILPALRQPAPLSPSDLGGEKVLGAEKAGLAEDAAKARGTAIHLLLEHLPGLPADDWQRLATHLLADPDIRADALAEATGVLGDAALAWIFGNGSLAEVPVAALLGQERMLGTIDRLIVMPDRVCIVDFKSNAVVPPNASEVPEGLLRQMGAYVEALRQIYPLRRIEPFILWTRNARLMPLDPDIVSVALSRAAIP